MGPGACRAPRTRTTHELTADCACAQPWLLSFLKDVRTTEHVSTVATRTSDQHAFIQNVGLKGARGKGVPFYYLHWWELFADGPSSTRLVEYELLKGSKIKFLLGATQSTLETHRLLQSNLRLWAAARQHG